MNALTNGGEVVQVLGSVRDAIKFYRCFYMSAVSVASWLVDAVGITGCESMHVFMDICLIEFKNVCSRTWVSKRGQLNLDS